MKELIRKQCHLESRQRMCALGILFYYPMYQLLCGFFYEFL